MKGDSGLELGASRAGEPAGMRQLQADHQVTTIPELFVVGGQGRLAQAGQASLIRRRGQRLSRVRATVLLYGRGLATPNQFGATQAEMTPAPERPFGWSAVDFGVPTLHRLNAKPVADLQSAKVKRFGQGGPFGRRQDGVVRGERKP